MVAAVPEGPGHRALLLRWSTLRSVRGERVTACRSTSTDVRSGGAAAFDARFVTPGVYGLVSHTFANVSKGEIGAIEVGDAHGTMAH